MKKYLVVAWTMFWILLLIYKLSFAINHNDLFSIILIPFCFFFCIKDLIKIVLGKNVGFIFEEIE